MFPHSILVAINKFYFILLSKTLLKDGHIVKKDIRSGIFIIYYTSYFPAQVFRNFDKGLILDF